MRSKIPAILIAPNAFKHSLSATQVAEAIGEGLKSSGIKSKLIYFPIGDGGDGTIELILHHLKGEQLSKMVTGPLGKPVKASYGMIRNRALALIEMAEASGIKLLNEQERNPMKATSYGTGELIKDALDKGAKQLVIGMGGSATVDGGCGILAALGARFYDDKGKELEAYPAELQSIAKVDLGRLDVRLKTVEIIILCDVGNRLLGPQGAAAVFGPQKGASVAEIPKLDKFLKRLAAQLKQLTGREMASIDSGGVAGGAAGGLYAALNARLVNGINHFMELTGFEQVLAKATVLITGEGSLDSQTLGGKAPYGVGIRAKKKGIPVIAVAGKVPLMEDAEMHEVFDVVLSIGNEPMDLEEALKSTPENLVRTGAMIGRFLAMKAIP